MHFEKFTQVEKNSFYFLLTASGIGGKYIMAESLL